MNPSCRSTVIRFLPNLRVAKFSRGREEEALFHPYVDPLLLDEITHDAIEDLSRHNVMIEQNVTYDILNLPQANGFISMLSFELADTLSGGGGAHFELFKNHVLLGMMAAIWIIQKIADHRLQ